MGTASNIEGPVRHAPLWWLDVDVGVDDVYVKEGVGEARSTPAGDKAAKPTAGGSKRNTLMTPF